MPLSRYYNLFKHGIHCRILETVQVTLHCFHPLSHSLMGRLSFLVHTAMISWIHTHTHTHAHTHTHTLLSVPFELNQEHSWFSLGRAGTLPSSYNFLIAVSQTRTAPPSSNLTQTAAVFQMTSFTADRSLLNGKQLSWTVSCLKFILNFIPPYRSEIKHSPYNYDVDEKRKIRVSSIKYFTWRLNAYFFNLVMSYMGTGYKSK